MLPKAHRLRHRKDFNRVYREGLRRNSRHLTLRALKISPKPRNMSGGQAQAHIVLPRPNQGKAQPSTGSRNWNRPTSDYLSETAKQPSRHEFPTRIGISISTKVSKRATIRNRMKRQIKAAMFHLLPTIAPNWLIIISVHPKAIECDYWQFLRELEEMIKNLR
ncbi:MAG: ribonuclease P protein component [Leptolyngbyaceae cyanobacterium]